MTATNWDGGCRCGQVRFRASARPLITMACHCTGCQRMTASAFSLSAAIPSDAFAVAQGDPVIGGLHGPTRHYFCPHCMSWMFTRPAGMDWFVNVRSPLFEGAAWSAPFIDTFTSEMLPWAITGAKYAYPQFPPEEAFGALLAEFSAQAAAP